MSYGTHKHSYYIETFLKTFIMEYIDHEIDNMPNESTRDIIYDVLIFICAHAIKARLFISYRNNKSLSVV